ncbi:MAG: DUF5906 domain-containing protein [Infirmifilum sp.]
MSDTQNHDKNFSVEPERDVIELQKELENIKDIYGAEVMNRVERVLNVLRLDGQLDIKSIMLTLAEWDKLSIEERISFFEKIRGRLDVKKLAKWYAQHDNKYAESLNKAEEEGRDPPLPPPSVVAVYLATNFNLFKPAFAKIGVEPEYGLIVGRRFYDKEWLNQAARAISTLGDPILPSPRVFPPLLEALKSYAVMITNDKINSKKYLNLKNGAIELETLTLQEKLEDYIFTYELPSIEPEFIRDLREGRIDENYFATSDFYVEIRPHYSDKEWEKLKAVLGAILVPKPLKLIAIIAGEGDTRKTFLFTLIKRTLGKQAGAIDLSEMQQNRFALMNLIEARAVLTSEESRTVIKTINKLKRISGGDPLFIDRKFKPPVEMEDNPLKIYIFTNELPAIKEVDKPFLERLVIIQPQDPQPPGPEEMRRIERALEKTSDFLKFLLYCYWDLKRKGEVIPGKGSAEYESMLIRAQNNIYAFFDWLSTEDSDYSITFGPGLKTPASEFYDAYLIFCQKKGQQPMGRNTVYAYIDSILAEHGVIKTRDSSGIIFKGVKLNKKSNVELRSDENTYGWAWEA